MCKFNDYLCNGKTFGHIFFHHPYSPTTNQHPTSGSTTPPTPPTPITQITPITPITPITLPTRLLVHSSTRPLVNLSTRQLVHSSTCQLTRLLVYSSTNSSTRQLTRLLVHSSTRQLTRQLTRLLVNSSPRQLKKNPPFLCSFSFFTLYLRKFKGKIINIVGLCPSWGTPFV